MSAFRLYRHDFTLFQAISASDESRVPASGYIIKAYRRGTTSSQAKTITTAGGQTLTVRDIGDIQVGDTVQPGLIGAVRTISAISSGLITFAAGGSGTFSVVDGTRIIPTNNRPKTYLYANQGSPITGIPNQAATDSFGAAYFYTDHPIIDCIISSSILVDISIIIDQTGLGISTDSPQQWSAVGDGVTDDATAIRAAILRATADGIQRLVIPPGNYLVNSTITISNASGLSVVSGAPGQVSILFAHPAGAGFDLTGVCSDVSFEDIVFSTSTANTTIIQTGTGTIRFAAKRCSFTVASNRTGIVEQGIDGRIVDCVFTGSAPVTWVRLNGAQRTQLQGCFGIWSSNASGRIIDIDTGCKNIRLLNCDFKGNVTGNSAASGVVGLRNSGAGTSPRDIVLTGCHFGAGTTGRGVDIDAAQGFQAIGCTIEDSLVGYSIDAGTSIKIIGGTCVGIQNESVDINGGSNIRIVELESSDVSQAGAGTKDHINIAAGINDVSILGMTAGNFIRASGIAARSIVRIEAGASSGIQLISVRGPSLADFTDTLLHNDSTSAIVDFGHNLMSAGTLTHNPGPVNIADAVGAVWGLLLVGAAVTTAAAVNVGTVEFNHAGGTTFTTFTGGSPGQIVHCYFRNGNTTFTEGGNFKLATTPTTWTSNDTTALMWSASVGKWLELSRSVNTA